MKKKTTELQGLLQTTRKDFIHFIGKMTNKVEELIYLKLDETLLSKNYDAFVTTFCIHNTLLFKNENNTNRIYLTDVDIIGNLYLQKHNKTLAPEFLSENKDQLNQIHSYLNALTPLLKLLFFYSIVVDPSVLYIELWKVISRIQEIFYV